MLQKLLQGSLAPDVVSYSAMASACEKGKHWEEALQLLQEMFHTSLTPDVARRSAAISVCGNVQHILGWACILLNLPWSRDCIDSIA